MAAPVFADRSAPVPAVQEFVDPSVLRARADDFFDRMGTAPAAFVVARLPARPLSGGGDVAGQFDSYVLALSWMPAFCEGKPGKTECANRNPDRFDAKNLVLHGLWPNKANDSSHTYGYCGVDAATQALDLPATWCRMPALNLLSATMSRLTEIMPGTASCLQNHEWYKHGSCSGFSPDEYFVQSAAIVSFVAGTNFGHYLAAHAGQTVTADALLAAFERDFGAGSRRSVSLACAKAGGENLLLEVRLPLAHPLRPAAELGQMLLPGRDRKGNCPASFKLHELPAR